MSNHKTIARTVGILYIIGTVAGILSAVLTSGILARSDYLRAVSENESMMIWGAFFVLIMAFSLAMIPVVLFPVFRKYNEILALGAVLFRGALEAFAYMAIALVMLGLVSISRELPDAGPAQLASLHTSGASLLALQEWSVHILSIVFSVGALMIYWLFYISKLIPRWLSVWGLGGAALYLAVPLLVLFGAEEFGVLMAPLAIQEMFLALWLIIKGFNRASK